MNSAASLTISKTDRVMKVATFGMNSASVNDTNKHEMIMKRTFPITAAALAAYLSSAIAVRAGCTIDFESLALGTVVTNQYPGVTFSVQWLVPGQSCGGFPPLYMRIQTPAFGTSSSGSHCLKIDPGCPDVSPDYLRMVFASPQCNVSFTVGDKDVNYSIRSYRVDGTQIVPASFTVGGDFGVRTLVNVTSPASDIKRIEVQAEFSNFEAIDDLTFDAGPPIAEISSPLFGANFCGTSLRVYGRECVEDGTYGGDVLEYKPVYGTAWTNVIGYTSSLCTAGSPLYDWPVAAVPDGTYYLRITVTNKCGVSASDLTVVNLHRTIDAASIRTPVNGFIIGGRVCIDGSAYDLCFSHYAVEKKPLIGGSFAPVDGSHPLYSIPVNAEPLVSWNTADNTTPDGEYLLRVTTSNTCGLAASQQLQVTVDNTPPVGILTLPVECSKWHAIVPIYGTATDAHLAGWTLQYSDPLTHQWRFIVSGNSPVDGKLGEWDTTGLPACAYTLRLLVTDRSRVNLDCSTNSVAHQVEYLVKLDLVSDPLAQDTDGDGMPDVWESAHGFNPFDPADAALDADNDSRTNLEEYLAGTDPRSPASVLRITALAREVSGARVFWTTAGSHHYLLEAASDLVPGMFAPASPLLSVPPGAPATTNFLEVGGAAWPERFYRVRLAP